MKKIYKQPELEVAHLQNIDIVSASIRGESSLQLAGDRFRDFESEYEEY